MKRLIGILILVVSLALFSGCGDTKTTPEENATSEKTLEQELLGSWETEYQGEKFTLDFEDKDSYTLTVEQEDGKTQEIKGDYDLYNDKITFMPNSVDGNDEESYVSQNNLTENDYLADDYIFNDTDATYSLDGDTLTFTANGSNFDYTRVS